MPSLGAPGDLGTFREREPGRRPSLGAPGDGRFRHLWHLADPATRTFEGPPGRRPELRERAAPVLGWRGWAEPLGDEGEDWLGDWRAGVNRAYCRQGLSHSSPADPGPQGRSNGCGMGGHDGCGLHAYDLTVDRDVEIGVDLSKAHFGGVGPIIGIVRGWGRVLDAAWTGAWRAEFAEILVLATAAPERAVAGGQITDSDRVGRLAVKYEVQLLDLEEMKAVVIEAGARGELWKIAAEGWPLVTNQP